MPPEITRLRATVEHLARLERASASPGEREAAEWIRDRFAEVGLPAWLEEEPAHGTYWVPLGLLTTAAGIAGLAGRTRRGRRVAAVVGAVAAAGIADEVSAGPHLFRRVLPRGTTTNVVAEAGDSSAERTLVFVAHHDAAHGGLVFAPELVTVVADRFPAWYAKQETSPQIMQLVAAGPALVAVGALTGIAALRRTGTAVSLLSAAAFADIAARGVVPGANDNLTAVATLLELARLLQEEPVQGVRVVLVSTGSEESFMEGMRGFMRRHGPSLPHATTEVVCLDSLGSPELIIIEGEGMLAMRDYPAEMRDALAEAARRAGVAIRRGLRLGLATDGLIAMRAGYRTAALGSVTRYKFPSNYHVPHDVPENVTWETVRDATSVCEALVRSRAREPQPSEDSSSRARSSASSRVSSSPT